MIDTLANDKKFHSLLIGCQKDFLLSVYELARLEPVLCSNLFDIDVEFCLSCIVVEREYITEAIDSINHWILTSISYEQNHQWNGIRANKFEDWVNFISNAKMQKINDKLHLSLPSNVSEHINEKIKDILETQVSLLLAVGDAAVNNIGFCAGIIGFEKKILSKLSDNWFNNKKVQAFKKLGPLLTINKKLNASDALNDKERTLSIETALYAFN